MRLEVRFQVDGLSERLVAAWVLAGEGLSAVLRVDFGDVRAKEVVLAERLVALGALDQVVSSCFQRERDRTHIIRLALVNDLDVLLEVLVRPKPLGALVATKLLVLLVRVDPNVSLEVRVPSKRAGAVRAQERTLQSPSALPPSARARKTHLASVRAQVLLEAGGAGVALVAAFEGAGKLFDATARGLEGGMGDELTVDEDGGLLWCEFGRGGFEGRGAGFWRWLTG